MAAETVGYQVIMFQRLGPLLPEDGKYIPLTYEQALKQRSRLRREFKDDIYNIEPVKGD